jgi:DNA-binding response OmpR family regulator
MSGNCEPILCVGSEQALMELGRAVLARTGYKAKIATPSEAESLLEAERFHLIVLSARVSEEERSRVLAAAGDAPIVALEALSNRSGRSTGKGNSRFLAI